MSVGTVLPKVEPSRGLRLIVTLVTSYPKLSAIIVSLLLLSGLAEGIGVATVMPLLSSLQDSGSTPTDSLSLIVRDAFALIGLEATLTSLVVAIVVLMVLKAALIVVAMRQVGFAMAQFGHSLREALLRAIVACKWSYFTKQPLGELANAMTAESHRAVGAFWAATNFVTMLMQIAVYVLLASLVSWVITAGAIIAGFVLFLVLQRFVAMARAGGQQSSKSYNDLSKRLVDGVAGIKSIKAMALESRLSPMLEAENENLLEAQKKMVVSKESLTALQEPVIIVLLAVGVLIVTTLQSIEFDVLIMMALLFQRMVSRVGRLQSAYQALLTAEGYYNRISSIIRNAESEKEVHNGVSDVPLSKGIQIEGLSFSYADGSILQDVNIDIPKGRTVTVFGPSGAGKSTLVDLVVGLQSPDSGRVAVDGVPLNEIDIKKWRSQIGYVPQDLFLFHETIRNNITLGAESISDSDVEAALRAAGAWDFVVEQKAGLDSIVGERGAALSGGQRQRIAIARALVRKPSLLILDEPTTALDPANEASICETLAALKGGVTILAISHQKALVDIADTVYRLEAGRIVGTSPPRDMQARPEASVGP